MGGLVAMSRSKPQQAREAFEPGHSAEILFFTGVRYVRFDDSGRDMPAPVTPNRKRRPTAKQRAAEAHRLAAVRHEALA